MTSAQFAAVAEELVARNYALLPSGDDLGLSIFVTPGTYPTYAAGEKTGDPHRLPAHVPVAVPSLGREVP